MSNAIQLSILVKFSSDLNNLEQILAKTQSILSVLGYQQVEPTLKDPANYLGKQVFNIDQNMAEQFICEERKRIWTLFERNNIEPIDFIFV